jgi:hypothetical protein
MTRLPAEGQTSPEWADIVLENQHLRLRLLPAKGSDIVELTDKRTGIDVLWHWRPLRDNDGTLPQRRGEFAEWHAGGWPEVIPNGDLPCTHRGIEHEPAGEAWRLPWSYEASATWAKLAVDLETLPLRVSKRLQLLEHGPVLRLDATVENTGQQDVEFLWNIHPTVGAPLLAAGATVDVPPCLVEVCDLYSTSRLEPGPAFEWPALRTRDGLEIDASRVPGPEAGSSDLLLLHGLSDGWAAIRNEEVDLGFAIRWDTGVFRRLWLWQGYGAGDPPWSDCYALAIEPAVGTRTLTDSASRGEVLRLGRGERLQTIVEACTFSPAGAVSGVDAGGGVRFNG